MSQSPSSSKIGATQIKDVLEVECSQDIAFAQPSFDLLHKHRVIDLHRATLMRSMVVFRNISVHGYEQIEPDIVNSIVKNHIVDFEDF